jgi:hypothetical protein
LADVRPEASLRGIPDESADIQETFVWWSVTVIAAGDRVLEREEIVELADAVASHQGVASGIGTTSYGARLLVEASTRDAAVQAGTNAFREAAARAGLPAWLVTQARALADGEDEDEDLIDDAGAAAHREDDSDGGADEIRRPGSAR